VLKVSIYSPEHKSAWDSFVQRSKNGIFLFRRDYMEYHADRFEDCSLLFHDESDRLAAILPASIKEGVVTSHAGLTFGGVVSDDAMKASLMLELFGALEAFLKQRGVERLVYKAVPHIYHRAPAEEDRYALFRYGARPFRCDISSTIDLGARLPFSKGRRYAVKQALKAGLQVKRDHDFESFMRMEEELLAAKYDVKPTHSAAELELLASRFPEQIKLFTARLEDDMVAGVVVYDYDSVLHAQYIAATDQGKRIGALDLVLHYLINDYQSHARYFDFGISTERDGHYLNEGLIENKQGFGGRAVVHDIFEWQLTAG
jgi:hypothetical protein